MQQQSWKKGGELGFSLARVLHLRSHACPIECETLQFDDHIPKQGGKAVRMRPNR